MSKNHYILLLSLIYFIAHTSCKSVYQNSLFTNVDSTALATKLASLTQEYKIQPYDELFVKLYTRDGAPLVENIKADILASQDASGIGIQNQTYAVDGDGMATLPIIGKIKVQGMTESNLKKLLEDKFSKTYQNPFVTLRVDNRRVFVFKGSQAMVIPINRTPTSIFEVIAKSGGLERHISTRDAMIVRGNLKNPTVYKMNLSSFDGMKTSELIVQPNDIIYLPEKNRKLYHALSDIQPLITVPLAIVSSALTSVLVYITLTK